MNRIISTTVTGLVLAVGVIVGPTATVGATPAAPRCVLVEESHWTEHRTLPGRKPTIREKRFVAHRIEDCGRCGFVLTGFQSCRRNTSRSNRHPLNPRTRTARHPRRKGGGLLCLWVPGQGPLRVGTSSPTSPVRDPTATFWRTSGMGCPLNASPMIPRSATIARDPTSTTTVRVAFTSPLQGSRGGSAARGG